MGSAGWALLGLLMAAASGEELNSAPSSGTLGTATIETANAQTAAVDPPIRCLDLVAQDLIYDPGTRRIYASTPNIAGSLANSIVTIDPETGVMLSSTHPSS